MTSKKSNQYLEVQVKTASKEQLLLMLYDGCIRFCELAKKELEAKNIEGSHNYLVRAKAIVVELMCSLDKQVGEELYANLIRLYNFVYLRLVDSNFNKNATSLEEAVEIIRSLRGTWGEAIIKSTAENGGHTYAPESKSSNFSIQG